MCLGTESACESACTGSLVVLVDHFPSRALASTGLTACTSSLSGCVAQKALLSPSSRTLQACPSCCTAPRAGQQQSITPTALDHHLVSTDRQRDMPAAAARSHMSFSSPCRVIPCQSEHTIHKPDKHHCPRRQPMATCPSCFPTSAKATSLPKSSGARRDREVPWCTCIVVDGCVAVRLEPDGSLLLAAAVKPEDWMSRVTVGWAGKRLQ